MSFRAHMPSFGYAVSKPYPYKWFPWVVLVGGICATVLFSLINFAANGYQLTVEYTTNPNTTESRDLWTQHWPFSWFDKVSPTCQGQTFQVNSQFFTDKLSLPYTITGVFQNRTTDNVLPSLQYMNNILKNCTINEMVFNLDSSSRTANQITTYDWGIEASAYITCYVDNGDTPTWLNLTTTYDYLTQTLTANPGSQGAGFLQLDKQNKTSLWWGQSLLGWYYLSLAEYLKTVQSDEGNKTLMVKGTFRNEPRWWDATGLTDLGYFHNVDKIVYSGVDSSGHVLAGINYVGTDNTAVNYLGDWPQLFPQADQYSKIFYSSILADLGNASPENVLTDPVLLQNWTSDFREPSKSHNDFTWDYMGPAFSSYKSDLDPGGPLNITPSRIYAEYFCQVPQRKSAGSLIIAIFIADLVFLQALWKLLNWVTTAWVEQSDSQCKYCEGCLALMDRGHELGPMTRSTSRTGVASSERPELGVIRSRHVSSESLEPLVR